MTFDGDVTLYDDGESLEPDNDVIPRILALMSKGVRIGIVTAAGYTDASKYYGRLHGLVDAVNSNQNLTQLQKRNMVVMGGESNYLFRFDDSSPSKLSEVPAEAWLVEEMRKWTEKDVEELLEVAEGALNECVRNMELDAQVLRKKRAVGVVAKAEGRKITREQLEETVLVTQKILVGTSCPQYLTYLLANTLLQEMSPVGSRLPFCAFNGKNFNLMIKCPLLLFQNCFQLITAFRWQ